MGHFVMVVWVHFVTRWSRELDFSPLYKVFQVRFVTMGLVLVSECPWAGAMAISCRGLVIVSKHVKIENSFFRR